MDRRSWLRLAPAAALLAGRTDRAAPPDPAPGGAAGWVGEGFVRRTVYHSPQTPGYTCWVGAWPMPDRAPMICFTQNTGPVGDRPRAPADVVRKFPMLAERPARDATGLAKTILFLRSADGGETWEKAGEIPFEGPMAYCAPGGQDLALPDGTILKGVFGYFLPTTPVPQTAYLLRSTDGGKTWGRPEPLNDPDKETWRLTRLRALRDGRLVATGGRSRTPSTSPISVVWKRWEPLLVVSEDGGRTWGPPVEFLPDRDRDGWLEEWDTAELPGGDLLCVFRRVDPAAIVPDPDNPGRKASRNWAPSPRDQVRWHGRLRKTGKTWALDRVGPAPFPHSGHPELLATREGPVL